MPAQTFSASEIIKAKERILFALDVTDLKKAKELLHIVGHDVGGVKIGLEAISSIGAPEMIKLLDFEAAETFYDGKFHDISNTVGQASAAISRNGHVKFLNVHASSGDAAIKAAVQNRGKANVLVVTILTSITEEECLEIYGDTIANKVIQFALKGKRNGAQGVICAPAELGLIAKHPELSDLIKVTPNIQPEWMEGNDQNKQRSMTPGEAIRAGADYLVIGRGISEHHDPTQAIHLISLEIAQATRDRLAMSAS